MEDDNSTLPFGVTQADADLSEILGTVSQVLVVIGLICYMVGVGAALDFELFKKAWTKPKPPLVGLFCQVCINPLVIFGVIAFFSEVVSKDGFPVETKVMAIIIAAAPGGNGSNLLTYLAFGAAEISIAMTIISTIIGFGTIPLFIWLGSSVLFPLEDELVIPYTSVVISAVAASVPPVIGLYLQFKLDPYYVEKINTIGVGIGVVFTIIVGCLYLADPVFRAGMGALGAPIWGAGIMFNVCLSPWDIPSLRLLGTQRMNDVLLPLKWVCKTWLFLWP